MKVGGREGERGREMLAGSPSSEDSTVGTALCKPRPCCADSILATSVASTVALVAPRPATGARANVTEVVPRFLASRSQEGARGWNRSQSKECSRSRGTRSCA